MRKFLTPGRKRALRSILAVAVVGVVGYFFAKTLIENWSEVVASGLHPNWLMLPAIIAFAAAVPQSGLLWRAILQTLDPTIKLSRLQSMCIQCLSWILKYIPGQVGSVANKIIWGRKKNVSAATVTVSFIYENIFLVTASLIPGIAIVAVTLGTKTLTDNPTTLLLPLLALIPLLALTSKRLFAWITTQIGRRLLHTDLSNVPFLSAWQSAWFQLQYIGPRIVNGIGFVFTVQAITPVPPSAWVPLAAAYVIAGAVGLLVPLAPSGLGVREAVIVAIASQYVPVASAIVFSIAARLLSTIGDIVVALFYFATRRTLKEKTA